jgi:hypothetical protein
MEIPFSPETPEELYNLCHASARNVVERIFGVLKKKWGILTQPPQYSLSIQAQVPPALAAVHNFIMDHDPEDINEYLTNSEDDLDPNPGSTHSFENYGALSQHAVDAAEKAHAGLYRDWIASAMWDQYISYFEDSDLDMEDNEYY